MYQGRPSVLYIHGYESKPVAEKTSAIAELGCTVIAPQLHYKEVMGTYNRLKQLALEFKADWLIGSSLGGYSAFWLSQELQIPTLLFNPALAFRRIDPGLVSKDLNIYFHQHTIFLGLKDDTVDPVSTKSWLQQQNILEYTKLIEYSDNGHQISLPVFKEVIYQAASELDFIPKENLPVQELIML